MKVSVLTLGVGRVTCTVRSERFDGGLDVGNRRRGVCDLLR